MRIRIESEDTLPHWLIGDPARPERDVEDGLHADSQTLRQAPQITRNQQAMTGAEWEARRFFDRGNKGVAWEFENRRCFSSEIELMDFIQTLAPVEDADQLHVWAGDVWLRSVADASDGTFKEYKLPDAVVSLVGTQQEGKVGLRLTYRIQAGGYELGSEREGIERVSLAATGISSDSCQLVLFGTTSGGAFDEAETIFTGSAPATVPAGTILNIVIGDNLGTPVTKTFQVVAPGGSATGGRIKVETPFINNLASIAAAFANDTSVRAFADELDGRKRLYLGWKADPIGAPAEVVISLSFENATLGDGTINYECGSTGAAFNPGAILDDVYLVDADGVLLIADTDPA